MKRRVCERCVVLVSYSTREPAIQVSIVAYKKIPKTAFLFVCLFFSFVKRWLGESQHPSSQDVFCVNTVLCQRLGSLILKLLTQCYATAASCSTIKRQPL